MTTTLPQCQWAICDFSNRGLVYVCITMANLHTHTYIPHTNLHLMHLNEIVYAMASLVKQIMFDTSLVDGFSVNWHCYNSSGI